MSDPIETLTDATDSLDDESLQLVSSGAGYVYVPSPHDIRGRALDLAVMYAKHRMQCDPQEVVGAAIVFEDYLNELIEAE